MADVIVFDFVEKILERTWFVQDGRVETQKDFCVPLVDIYRKKTEGLFDGFFVSVGDTNSFFDAFRQDYNCGEKDNENDDKKND